MIIWTPTILSVLYACALYFCICTCSAQLSMFHMERRSRNTLIVIITSKPCKRNFFLPVPSQPAYMDETYSPERTVGCLMS